MTERVMPELLIAWRFSHRFPSRADDNRRVVTPQVQSGTERRGRSFYIHQRISRTFVTVLTLLSIYVLIGLFLATFWSGESAKRHVRGLKTFVLVVAAWPMILCAMIIAGRNF